MKARLRNEHCPVCHGFEQFVTTSSLDNVGKAAVRGCLRCKLLYASAMLFQDMWASELDGNTEETIDVRVSKAINGESGPVIAALRWPCGEDNSTALPLHITIEDS